MTLAAIDKPGRAYVLRSGARLAFDAVREETARLASELGRADLAPPSRQGTRVAYRAWTRARQARDETKGGKTETFA